MNKSILLLFLFLTIFFNSFGQEIESQSPTSKYQVDINLGYAHWISPYAYNNMLTDFPLSIALNFQKNIKDNIALSLAMDVIRAQEKLPFNNSIKQEMGAHFLISSEVGIKLYWGNKSRYFVRPQVGITLMRFPKLTAENEVTQTTTERTVANAFGLSFSGEMGAEFAIFNNCYFQPVIAITTSSVSGNYEISEQSWSGSNTTSYEMVTDLRNSILTFSLGIGKYF